MSVLFPSDFAARLSRRGIEMPEDSIVIEEYLNSYLPQLIEKRLAEKTVPDMEGTSFGMQLCLEGDKSLVYGITIEDARRITVTPGGIDNSIFTMRIRKDAIKPLVDFVSSFISRKQYDAVTGTKGRLDLKIGMPGDWTLPVTMVFNGAEAPQMSLSGPSADLMKIVRVIDSYFYGFGRAFIGPPATGTAHFSDDRPAISYLDGLNITVLDTLATSLALLGHRHADALEAGEKRFQGMYRHITCEAGYEATL